MRRNVYVPFVCKQKKQQKIDRICYVGILYLDEILYMNIYGAETMRLNRRLTLIYPFSFDY